MPRIAGNTLYGTTNQGGAYNEGTVFSVPVTGGTPTTLVTFNGASGINANGQNPTAGVIVSADGSTLYGTTSAGGDYNGGTVFSLSLAAAPEPSTDTPTMPPWALIVLAISIFGIGSKVLPRLATKHIG